MRKSPAAILATRLRIAWPPSIAGSVCPRPLPVIIFFAALFLSVKVGLIWRDTGSWLEGSSIAISGAQARSTEAAPVNRGEAAPDAKAPSVAHDGAMAHDRTAKPKRPAPAPTPETPAFSAAEVEVLRQLAGRRAALDARARELDKRDALLRAAEQRLDAKVKALKDLETRVAGLLRQHDREQDAKMESLAKLYESMKPKDAAAILQTLEISTLLRVAERMKERKLAAVMAKMNTARARDVTMELVRLRAINAKSTVKPPTPKPGRNR